MSRVLTVLFAAFLACLPGHAQKILVTDTPAMIGTGTEGILLGAGGVGLREFCDRLKQEIAAT